MFRILLFIVMASAFLATPTLALISFSKPASATDHFVGQEIEYEWSQTGPPGQFALDNMKVYFKNQNETNFTLVHESTTDTGFIPATAWNYIKADGVTPKRFDVKYVAKMVSGENSYTITYYFPNDYYLYAKLDKPTISGLSNGGSWALGNQVSVSWNTIESTRIDHFEILGKTTDNQTITLVDNISNSSRNTTWTLQSNAVSLHSVFVKCHWQDIDSSTVHTQSTYSPVTIQTPSVHVRTIIQSPAMPGPCAGVSIIMSTEGDPAWVKVGETDSNGDLTINVPAGWSGHIIPQQSFFNFTDFYQQGFDGHYTNVLGSIANQYWTRHPDSQWLDSASIAANTPQIASASFSSRGSGTTHFTSCPNNDGVPIHFEIAFDATYMTTDVSAEDIRLYIGSDSYPAINDLTSTNNFTAVFDVPDYAEAFDFDAVVKIHSLYWEYGGGLIEWAEIVRSGYLSPTVPAGRSCSFRPLDINTDGMINLADLGILAYANGSTEGDNNFDLRADLATSLTGDVFRIDLSDISVFSTHFRHNGTSKSAHEFPVSAKKTNTNSYHIIATQDLKLQNCVLVISTNYNGEKELKWTSRLQASELSLFAGEPSAQKSNYILYFENVTCARNEILGNITIPNEVTAGDVAVQISHFEASSVVLDTAAESSSIESDNLTKASFMIDRYSTGGNQLRFKYFLPGSEKVLIEIFDIRGRKMAEVENGRRAAGEHSASWDTQTTAGSRASSGLYLVRFQSDSAQETRKISVVR